MNFRHTEWLSPSQTARVLRLTPERVRQLAVADKLPHVETPNGRLYPRREIEELALSRPRRAAA